VYIVALTPIACLSDIRRDLQKVTIASLLAQTSTNWQALLVGEVEREEGNLLFLKSQAVSKGDKILFAMSYLERQGKKPKYIARLDDDDVISPNAIERIENLDYDCYADTHQLLFSLINGKTCFFRPKFMPNTVFHRYYCATSKVATLVGNTLVQEPLINSDHAQDFAKFYQGRRVLHSPKYDPIYLRVLSPVCETMMGARRTSPDPAFASFDKVAQQYGVWLYHDLPQFQTAIKEITAVAERRLGLRFEPKCGPIYNVTERFKRKVLSQATRLRRRIIKQS